MLFVALMMVGAALIPLLSLQIEPSRTSNSISINYNWRDASAEMMEHEITAKLEGIIATIKGVKNVKSISSNGAGQIQIDLDEYVNTNLIRYEISTLIRQIYPNLPEGASYPIVFVNRPGSDNEKKAILSYVINGKANSLEIQKYVEKHIKPQLGLIEGIYQINIYGVNNFSWELSYNINELNQLRVTANDIRAGINNYLEEYELGKAFAINPVQPDQPEYTFLTLKTNKTDSLDWSKIPIKRFDSRTIYLTDLVKVRYREQEPQTYYRLNGLNTVNIEVIAGKSTNYIVLADKIKEKVTLLKQQLPTDYSLVIVHDASDYLKKEIEKIALRSLATLLLLLIFVYAVSRQLRYLLLIVVSMICNLLLASILYYFIDLQIHLYSLAGITVSLGMIIDNSIVVIHHVRQKHDMRVSLALVGATMTTIGACSIIFFLNEQQQIKLIDFAWIMIINLSISLVVALWFIPALMEKIPIANRKSTLFMPHKRRVVRWNWYYDSLIGKFIRFRPYLIAGLVLLFGLPIFMLPPKIETDNWYARMYNSTVSRVEYSQVIKPWLEIALGGTIRLFILNDGQFDYQEESIERMRLIVNIKMPKGATLNQMNQIVLSFENYLSQFHELDMYQSRVNSGQNANIAIFFKQGHEGGFPYMLKNNLEKKAIYTGIADFSIFGVGQGFSNSLSSGRSNYGITLMGYNYDKLRHLANQVKGILLQNPRVENIFIGSHRDWQGEDSNYEFVLQVNNPEELLINQLPYSAINASLNEFSGIPQTATHLLQDGNSLPVILIPDGSSATLWEVLNKPARADSGRFVRLKDIASIEKEKVGEQIYRENQQYQLVVNYQFVGDEILGSKLAQSLTDEISTTLPLGYSVNSNQKNFWSGAETKLTWAIFLTLCIVFIICSTLLNSLWQSLIVIAMAPISFIGVFIVSFFFEYNFDEGGYAAFILLSGVVVNAALFILNDFNNIKQEYPKKDNRVLFIKAFNSKIIPALLSILSMVLGLLPFVVYSKNEPFWYALAISTLGGLIFSIVAITVFLPLFMTNMGSKSLSRSNK